MILVSLKRPGNRRWQYHGNRVGPSDPESLGSLVYYIVPHSNEVHVQTLMPASGCFGPISKTIIEIAWEAPEGYVGDRSSSGMYFYSTLPYGWIPNGIQDLVSSFLDHLKQLWLQLCEQAHTTISTTVRVDSQ